MLYGQTPVIFQPVFPKGARTVIFAVEGDGKFFVKIKEPDPVDGLPVFISAGSTPAAIN